MPARDKHHEIVRAALIKDGWTITHDPLRLPFGAKDMYVDLGAERLLAAEKGAQQIAVEIKSFTGPSELRDLEQALGQFVLYRTVIDEVEPTRKLYLAVPQGVADELFQVPLGKLLVDKASIALVGYNPALQEIVRWIPQAPTGI